jgi:2-succinyl-6-hydroxy-2,4-cyclohexadiene-1-carboxylate synthase
LATLPGHGGPTGAPVASGWSANLAQISRQLDGAEVVIGYSLGARIALGLVAAGLVERAVLIGANPGLDEAERPVRRARDATWAAVLRRDGLAAFIAAWQAQPLFASQARRAPAETRAARAAARLRHDPEQLARSLEELGLAEMPDYRPLMPSLANRLALIVGAEDLTYVDVAERLRAAAPELWLERIAASGHDPTLEQPAALAEAIARAVAHLARR